jgi:hypothetical protein
MTTLQARDKRGMIYSASSGATARFVALPWSRGHGWHITGDRRKPSGWYLLGDMLRLARVLGCDTWEAVGTEARELERD